jgi:phenylpropionate dioxygenase-like ring-hydroxylating dioxygenase large terminal subunit
MARLWPKVWQWACRVEHVPNVGDYYVYDIGNHSVLIVRSDDGGINAFHNACTHRATQLRPSGSSGSAAVLRCPFHGWTYDLDGKLTEIPCRWDFPHVGERHNLSPVRCNTWGGFVFINLSGDAQSLADYLEPLPSHLKDSWDLSKRVVRLHIEKELPNNWKAAQEAFLESYHVVETHADFLPIVADANAQYDVFGRHVSRFINPQGVPSPHYTAPITQQEILDRMLVSPAGTRVPDGRSARSVAAEELRKSLSATFGVDLTGYSTSEMLDSIEYHLFPNAFFFPGITLSMLYRFRPLGDDHSRTLFDIMFLRPLREGEAIPDAPDPIRLGIDDSYTTVADMPATLARVFDQDTGNLAAQWRGFFATDRAGETLGLYQESLIRHVHATVDEYLLPGSEPSRSATSI